MAFLAMKLKSELGHSFWITVLSVFVYIFKRENTPYARSYYYIILLYLHLISFVMFYRKSGKIKTIKSSFIIRLSQKKSFLFTTFLFETAMYDYNFFPII